MKKFKKEITAIVSGMVFAYVWQLFMLLMCYLSDPHGDFITGEMFIPLPSIQLAIVPMVAWVMMGFLKVSWFNTWARITMCGLAFLIPFMLITGITVIVAPDLWHQKRYWMVNIASCILLAFTLFKPLLQFKCSKVE